MNNILLIYGGNSVEHEISIITALQIKNKYKGKYNFILCYNKDFSFYVSKKLENISFYKNKNNLKKIKPVYFYPNNNYIKSKRKKICFEAVWLVCHGKNCEDGMLYSYFKTLNVAVVGENLYSAVIGHNKIISKKFSNIPTLPYINVTQEIFVNEFENLLNDANQIGFPLICKPADLGSSIGVVTINNKDELNLLQETFKYTNSIILEKKLENFEEYNIAMIKTKENYYLSSIEKVSVNKILTYSDKYLNEEKSMVSQKREVPAKISDELEIKIKDSAIKIYNDLFAEFIVRIDFLYDANTSTLYFNEINNIPGSLSFYLFEKNNISLNFIIDSLIDDGLQKIDKSKEQTTYFENNIFNHNSFDGAKIKK